MYLLHFDAILAAWNEGNLDGLDEFVDVHVRRRAPEAVNGNVDSLAELKKMITDFRVAFPDVKIAIDEMFFHDDRAFCRWTFTGTNTGDGEFPATGKSVKLSGCTFARYEGRKLVEELVYFDALDLMIQLGLVDFHTAHA